MVLLESRTDSKDYRAVATRLAEGFIENAVERDTQAGLPTYEVSQLRREGLLALNIPQEYGGAGADLLTAMKVTQQLSNADGSIGQLYSNHLELTTLAHVAGTAVQKEYYYRGTVQNLRIPTFSTTTANFGHNCKPRSRLPIKPRSLPKQLGTKTSISHQKNAVKWQSQSLLLRQLQPV